MNDEEKRRRKEAAVTIAKCRDIEGMAKFLTDKFECKDHDSVMGFECSNCGNISVHDRNWEPVARAVRTFLEGRGDEPV